MTISASYFDHVKYPAQEFINRDKDFIGNGVLKAVTDFALTYSGGMTVNAAAGTAWVNGLRIAYDANPTLTLTFAAADASNPRIDLVEIGTTGTGTQGAGIIQIVKGVAASSPLQPQPDSGFIGLYAVSIAANATQITAGNITDLRTGISISGATNTPLATNTPGTQVFNTTGSVGTSSKAAREDHIHPMPEAPVTSVNTKTGPVTLSASDVGAEPTISTKNTAFNQNFETSASNIKMDGTASVGTSNNVTRADHVHPSDTTKANQTDLNTTNANVSTNTTNITTVSNNLTSHLADSTYQTATGTATVITVTMATLTDGYAKTFIASASNGGAATTINGKPLYKPGTTTAPNLIAGKAYTVWYSLSSNCFFIKASAEGNVTTGDVLAGKTFSSDADTGLIGTLALTGTVGDAQVLAGQTYYNTDAKTKRTGTLANLSGQTVSNSGNTNGAAGSSKFDWDIMLAQTGYIDTTSKVHQTLTNLIAANLVSGVTIPEIGLTGSATIQSLGGKKFASSSFTLDANGNYTLSGLSFTPKIAIVKFVSDGTHVGMEASKDSYINNDFAVYTTTSGTISTSGTGNADYSHITLNSNGFSFNNNATTFANRPVSYIAIE